jgi:O-antigen ligase
MMHQGFGSRHFGVPPVVAGALAAGALTGLIIAVRPEAGLVLVVAGLFTALAMRNLPLAVALWIPMIFIEGIPGSRLAPEAVGSLVGIAWVAALRQGHLRAPLDRARPILLAVAAMLVFFTLSLAWAENTGAAAGYVWYFYETAVFLLFVITAARRPEDLRLLVGAFVAGAVLSVLIGFAALAAGLPGFEEGGRLMGGGGDANYFAAALVPAIALAGGLAVASPVRRTRWLAGLAVIPLVAGVAASQSRGGIVAAGAMLIVALVVFREHRWAVAAAALTIVALGGLYFVANPAAVTRLTHDPYGGSGREDLWRVGLRVAEDHPLLGVGSGNFEVVSVRYTQRSGSLSYGKGILRGQEPHNVYLGLLSEVGAIGLLLYLLVPLISLWMALAAARTFERSGRPDLANVARACFVGLTGAMTTSIFLPNATDKRAWVLFALGPAAYCLAREMSASAWRPAHAPSWAPRGVSRSTPLPIAGR